MHRFILTYILVLSFLFITQTTKAQFVIEGDEAFSTNWSQIESNHYKLIYPQGLDSLAYKYGRRLEQFWPMVGESSGYKPNQFYKSKMPIILHSNHGIANGMVVWSPRRMSLYTLPQIYYPSSIPWSKNLAVHESRHVSQMQFGKAELLKYPNYLIGEMFSAATSILYPNIHLLEGDAVVTETALTRYGRGRDADFLNYYMLAFDKGDFRTWDRWRYGSYKYYTPNHYALGYLTIAGARYLYDDPYFMKRYFSESSKKPWRLFNMKRTMEEASGKNFKKSFREICNNFLSLWKENAKKRGPFDSLYRLSPPSKMATEYKQNCLVNNNVYSVKTSFDDSPYLIRIDSSGKEKKLKSFSSYTSNLVYANGKLWWSESIPDIRWGLKMTSRIRSYDIKTNKIKDFTTKGRFFNPYFSNDNKEIVSIEITDKSKAIISILDTETAKVKNSISVSDSLQLVQAVFLNKDIAFVALSDRGAGLYLYKNHTISTLIGAQPCRMNNLQAIDSLLYFSSDRNGVTELYCFNPAKSEIKQISNLRYGGSYFCIDKNNNRLIFSSFTDNGRAIFAMDANNIEGKITDYKNIYEHKWAAKLSNQEKNIAKENHIEWPDSIDYKRIKLSKAKAYKGIKTWPKIHSWLPYYIKIDNPSSLNFNEIYASAGLGTVLFLQNDLGNVYGNIAYKYAKDQFSNHYRSSIHANLTYTGLYPIFNLNIDIGDRHAFQYKRYTDINPFFRSTNTRREKLKYPSFKSELLSYIPLNFSSSSWNRGIIPYILYTFTNDLMFKPEIKTQLSNTLVGTSFKLFPGLDNGSNSFIQHLSLGIRLYSIQQKAASNEYPRYGISTQLSYQQRLMLNNLYSSSANINITTYLPAILKSHSMRLVTSYQQQFNKSHIYSDNYLTQLPRGINSSKSIITLNNYSDKNLFISLDYAIPIYVGDIDIIAPIAYIKYFSIIPHFDISNLYIVKISKFENIASIGSEFNINTSNLIVSPIESTIGLSYSYNMGSLYNSLKHVDKELSRHSFSLVFRVRL